MVEGRVLGALVEKQLTTPQLYPLTENALLAACNQTTSREPVVSYDVSTLRIAVRSLREDAFLRTVHRSGERSDKHQHQLDTALGLDPGQVTLLAVLLLRGPQTMAELRARSERMHRFGSLDQVEEALDAMGRRNEPLVTRLERQPGRKEPRYLQLLAEVEPGQAVGVVPARSTPEPTYAVPAAPPRPAAPAPTGGNPTVADLVREVARLRDEVAQLRAQVESLRADIGDIG
jgi:uncharacterized protein